MTKQTNDLPLVKTQSGAVELARPQPTVADMLRLVVDKGISSENVSAFSQLVGLHREEVKLIAEKEFAAAFLELQRELPTINAARGVPDKQGRIKFVYANFDDIDAIVRPICLRHGFTYAFRQGGHENGCITTVMTLQHAGGHFREIPYGVRIGAGPCGASETQADGSAHTYGQRGALEQGLALRIAGAREDARMEGGPITPAQADELARRVAETNSDRTAFLKFAGAPSFKEIAASRYDDLDAMLTRKERAR